MIFTGDKRILSALLILTLFFVVAFPAPAKAGSVVEVVVSVVSVAAIVYSAGLASFAVAAVSSAVGAVVVDLQSCSMNALFGCGGGGSGGNSGANSASGGSSCPSDQKLCGTEYCIPKDAVCCQSVGFPDKYCEAGFACTTDGQCQKDGDQACSDLKGTNCVSPANSCGQTDAAKYLCDGSCFATAPPDSSCPNPDMTLSTLKAFTDKGKACTIKWSTTNATSCTLSGPGVSVTGTSGQIDTPPLQETTTFNLTCKNGTVVTASKEVTCYLTPHFEEF